MQSNNNRRCYNCINCIAKLPVEKGTGIIRYDLGKVDCKRNQWSHTLKFVTSEKDTYIGYGLGEGIRENTVLTQLAEHCKHYEE